MKLSKKYVKPLSKLFDSKLFVLRYLVNFISFVEILLIPVIVDESIYLEIEYFRNVILVLPLFLLGINSGFLVSFYSNNKIDVDSYFTISVLLIVSASSLSYLILKNIYLSLYIFLYLFYLILEKILIAKNSLILASSAKLFSSIFVIIFLFYSYNFNYFFDFDIFINLYLFGLLVWFLFLYSSKIVSLKLILNFKETILSFKRLISLGFFLSLQTWSLFLFILIDRDYIINNFSDDASGYSFAYSVSSVFFVALNTISYGFQNKLGNDLKLINKKYFLELFRIHIVFFILLLLLSTVFIYILSLFSFTKKYDNFLTYIPIILLFFGGYYFLISYSVILNYSDKLKFVSLSFLLTCIFGSFLNFFASSALFIVLKSFSILFIYSLFIIFYLYKRLPS